MCAFTVQTLSANCQQSVVEHQNYEIGCQLARDWLTVSRDRLNTCVNVVGDQQHLEAAQNTLAVTTDRLLTVVRKRYVVIFVYQMAATRQ